VVFVVAVYNFLQRYSVYFKQVTSAKYGNLSQFSRFVPQKCHYINRIFGLWLIMMQLQNGFYVIKASFKRIMLKL
jgi:hypothetical protein